MHIVESISPGGANESELVALEQLFGSPLPADYRRFLSESNGGRPEPSEFTFQWNGKPQDSVLDWLFTLNGEETDYCLMTEIDRLAGRAPECLCPIGCDPFGNLILLDIGAKSFGTIYFWDHENENPDGEPWWKNIFQIAPSFTDFINGLH